jgi:hypothetical protein
MRKSPAKIGILVLSASVSKVQKEATLKRISRNSAANAADIPVFERL